jgi:hypothetical protein
MALLGLGGNHLHYGTLWDGSRKLSGMAGGSKSRLDSGIRSHDPVCYIVGRVAATVGPGGGGGATAGCHQNMLLQTEAALLGSWGADLN